MREQIKSGSNSATVEEVDGMYTATIEYNGKTFRYNDDIETASEAKMIASEMLSELDSMRKAAATFKCPECGTKVLEQTSYCVKCKKKVKKASITRTAAKIKVKGKGPYHDAPPVSAWNN